MSTITIQLLRLYKYTQYYFVTNNKLNKQNIQKLLVLTDWTRWYRKHFLNRPGFKFIFISRILLLLSSTILLSYFHVCFLFPAAPYIFFSLRGTLCCSYFTLHHTVQQRVIARTESNRQANEGGGRGREEGEGDEGWRVNEIELALVKSEKGFRRETAGKVNPNLPGEIDRSLRNAIILATGLKQIVTR